MVLVNPTAQTTASLGLLWQFVGLQAASKAALDRAEKAEAKLAILQNKVEMVRALFCDLPVVNAAEQERVHPTHHPINLHTHHHSHPTSTPSHPIPSLIPIPITYSLIPSPSHPTPIPLPHPTPIPHYPIPSHPIPSHPILSHPPSHPTPTSIPSHPSLHPTAGGAAGRCRSGWAVMDVSGWGATFVGA